jgi:hypothetical protein
MFADKIVNLGIAKNTVGKSRDEVVKSENSLFSCHYPDGIHVLRLGKNKALLN